MANIAPEYQGEKEINKGFEGADITGGETVVKERSVSLTRPLNSAGAG